MIISITYGTPSFIIIFSFSILLGPVIGLGLTRQGVRTIDLFFISFSSKKGSFSTIYNHFCQVRMKTAICMDLETSPCLITCPAATCKCFLLVKNHCSSQTWSKTLREHNKNHIPGGAGPQGTSTRLVTSTQPSRALRTTSARMKDIALGDAHLAMMTSVERSTKQSK